MQTCMWENFEIRAQHKTNHNEESFEDKGKKAKVFVSNQVIYQPCKNVQD